MNFMPTPDCLEVINGPEDGSEFPIIRTPIDVGADPLCALNLCLDQKIADQHARITVVSEGYRVRRLDKAPVWVNGEPTGMVYSRILRPGNILKLGDTELIFRCSPDGLAMRSRGVTTEGDLVWALKLVKKRIGYAVWQAYSFSSAIAGKFVTPFVIISFALLALALLFWDYTSILLSNFIRLRY